MIKLYQDGFLKKSKYIIRKNFEKYVTLKQKKQIARDIFKLDDEELEKNLAKK